MVLIVSDIVSRWIVGGLFVRSVIGLYDAECRFCRANEIPWGLSGVCLCIFCLVFGCFVLRVYFFLHVCLLICGGRYERGIVLYCGIVVRFLFRLLCIRGIFGGGTCRFLVCSVGKRIRDC